MAKVSFDAEDGNWDFFSRDFMTQLAPHESECSPRSYARLNARYASEYVMQTGSVDTARWDEDGNEVDVEEVDFPFYVRFVPNRDALPQTEFSTETAWYDQLTGSNIPVGTKMFDVYAMWGSPCDGRGCDHNKIPSNRPLSEMTMIGEITSTSEFTTSLWGDERLFFQHNHLPDDLNENKGGDNTLNFGTHYFRFQKNDFGGNYPMNVGFVPPEADDETVVSGIVNSACPFQWMIEALEDFAASQTE